MVGAISTVQSIILHAAAGSDNRVLSLPEHLEHEAAEEIAAKFPELGWVRQIKAVKDRPVWRNDPATGATFSLKLTRIGMIAAAALGEESGADAETSIQATIGPEVETTVCVEQTSESLHTDANNLVETADGPRAPRGGLKLDQVLTMLKADGGATMEEIMVATDWLPHSTRAVLTGLRKRGYPPAARLGRAAPRDGLRITPDCNWITSRRSSCFGGCRSCAILTPNFRRRTPAWDAIRDSRTAPEIG